MNSRLWLNQALSPIQDFESWIKIPSPPEHAPVAVMAVTPSCLSVMGLVDVKLFWYVDLKCLEWLWGTYGEEARNQAAGPVTFQKNKQKQNKQDLKRASFLSGIIQENLKWRGSQGWNIDAASHSGGEQSVRSERGQLQAMFLITHAFVTIKCVPRSFTSKNDLSQNALKCNGINRTSPPPPVFLLGTLLRFRIYYF